MRCTRAAVLEQRVVRVQRVGPSVGSHAAPNRGLVQRHCVAGVSACGGGGECSGALVPGVRRHVHIHKVSAASATRSREQVTAAGLGQPLHSERRDRVAGQVRIDGSIW